MNEVLFRTMAFLAQTGKDASSHVCLGWITIGLCAAMIVFLTVAAIVRKNSWRTAGIVLAALTVVAGVVMLLLDTCLVSVVGLIAAGGILLFAILV